MSLCFACYLYSLSRVTGGAKGLGAHTMSFTKDEA